MILNKHNLNELNKNIFFVIKNLLNEKEIEKSSNILKTNGIYIQISKKKLTIKGSYSTL